MKTIVLLSLSILLAAYIIKEFKAASLLTSIKLKRESRHEYTGIDEICLVCASGTEYNGALSFEEFSQSLPYELSR